VWRGGGGGGVGSAPRSGRFTPGNEPVPIIHIQSAGWAPGPVCTGANVPPPGFDPGTVQLVASRSADYVNPAHSSDTYCLQNNGNNECYTKQ
jgi:hypothetical protein